MSGGARNPGDPSTGSFESQPGYPLSRNLGPALVRACGQILQLARLNQHSLTDPHRLDLSSVVLTHGPRRQADGFIGFLDSD
jgi:hypothetical protein